MGERKVISKYYPPDFDPAKVPRGKKADLNMLKVRMMLPMSIRCGTCGTFMAKVRVFFLLARYPFERSEQRSEEAISHVLRAERTAERRSYFSCPSSGANSGAKKLLSIVLSFFLPLPAKASFSLARGETSGGKEGTEEKREHTFR